MAKKKEPAIGADKLQEVKLTAEDLAIEQIIAENDAKLAMPGTRLLNPRQEMFCRLYATQSEFFGNGVQSYIEVYNPNQTRPNWYDNARAAASALLTNPNVLTRVNELIDASGMNDAHMDKQLYLVATQNADFKAKVSAINEYNKLKKRISDKLELTLKTMSYADILKDQAEHPEKYESLAETPKGS